MKKILYFMLLFLVVAAPLSSVAAKPAPVVTDAFSLIVEVNALRAANGLPMYTISPILMGTAQQHAEFMSVHGVTHTGYGGTRPYQRALNAGYPLAGDLSLGGFISENITAGPNKSVQQAVLDWQGDYPHLHTMLSADLMEIGAGVAIVDGYVYYVIDCARPTGAKPPTAVNTAAPGETQQPESPVDVGPPLARTVITNTPSADGKLYHIVGPGETLWLIAISYGVKIAEIRQLNYMTEAEAIYPGDKLLIRKDAILSGQGVAVTPASVTPALLTPSETPGVTFNSLPTLQQDANSLGAVGTPLSWSTQITPYPTGTTTSVPAAPLSSDSSIMVVGTIVLAALVLAGVLARAGRQA
jgi:LysM repeat protein